MAKVLFLFGLLEMVEETMITATVMDTRIPSTVYLYLVQQNKDMCLGIAKHVVQL